MAVISFQSNIASLQAQRRLSQSTSAIGDSFVRLSTGLRINRASDDAAGLAIAEQLRTDQRLHRSAMRNINDGLSLLNVAGGAIEQQANILIRLKELAEQSATGTLSDAQRRNLNAEYQALIDEFGRIGDSTTFNGRNLLWGKRLGAGTDSIGIQAGVDGDSDAQISMQTIDSGSISGTFDSSKLSSAFPIGMNDSVTTDELMTTFRNRVLEVSVIDSAGVKRDLLIGFTSTSLGGQTNLTGRVYQRVSDTGGVGAQSSAGTNGEVQSLSDDWVYAGISSGSGGWDNNTGERNFGGVYTHNLEFMNGTTTASLTYDMRGMKLIHSGNHPDSPESIIDFTRVDSVSRASTALSVITNRLSEINSQQGVIGAIQSRLSSSLAVNETSVSNIAAAESQIRDVDVATESATLTSLQIRQRLAAAVVARANLQPQLLLRLLTGA